MAVYRRALTFSLVVIVILGSWAWRTVERMTTSIDLIITQRYQTLAVRSLSQKALLDFERRDFPGGARKYWHQDDVPCIKFVGRVLIQQGNGGQTSGSWPAGNAVTCRDFSATIVGAPIERTQLPESCYPVLAVSHAPNDSSYNVVLAVAHQFPRVERPELHRGWLKEDEQNEIIAKLDSQKTDEQKFIETGALKSVAISLVSNNQCKGFDLYSYKVELPDISNLTAKVSIGMK